MLLNSLQTVVNGPWTRYDPSDPEDENKKSVLDLVIISKNMEKYFDSMVIDSNLENTPCRVKSKSKIVYTGHYSMLVSFKNIPLKGEKVKNGIREVIWNTKREGGWIRYKEDTNQNQRLESIANICTNRRYK